MDEAFETLRYNVEIDQDSLAEQLERVRNQIDLSMGSMAFSADRIPRASDVVGISGGIYDAPNPALFQQSLQSPGLMQTEQSF